MRILLFFVLLFISGTKPYSSSLPVATDVTDVENNTELHTQNRLTYEAFSARMTSPLNTDELNTTLSSHMTQLTLLALHDMMTDVNDVYQQRSRRIGAMFASSYSGGARKSAQKGERTALEKSLIRQEISIRFSYFDKLLSHIIQGRLEQFFMDEISNPSSIDIINTESPSGEKRAILFSKLKDIYVTNILNIVRDNAFRRVDPPATNPFQMDNGGRVTHQDMGQIFSDEEIGFRVLASRSCMRLEAEITNTFLEMLPKIPLLKRVRQLEQNQSLLSALPLPSHSSEIESSHNVPCNAEANVLES